MIVPIPSDRAEWLKLRQGYIGGSEIACLFDAQPPYQHSKFSLWNYKAAHLPREFDESIERARWGILMEPVVAHEAARVEGWAIEHGGFATDDTTPGMSATLDYRVLSHSETAPGLIGPGVLEIKCVDYLVYKQTWGGSPPLHIELQHQHQMACSGYAWGAIAALISGNELKIWKRRARPKLIDQIRERVAAFWLSIEKRIPPSVDGTDSTAETLKALYAVAVDEEADIPDELIGPVAEACAVYLQEAAMRIAGERRETAVKNLIRVAMGKACRATIPAPDFSSPAYRIKRTANGRLIVTEQDPSK